MAQTGIPFGQVGLSRDFLRIDGEVGKPIPEHPKRPVDGFSCKRNEVSGERFWSFFRSVSQTPENFARNCLVYNHCPLVNILEFSLIELIRLVDQTKISLLLKIELKQHHHYLYTKIVHNNEEKKVVEICEKARLVFLFKHSQYE
jgi:hypothetical protein